MQRWLQSASRYLSWPLRAPWWQLLVLAILLIPLTLTLLRQNNLGMIERREAVLAADKTGDKVQIQRALSNLQNYSAAHMNAETGVIYLQESYDRDARASIVAQQQASNPQASVYQQAAVECQGRAWDSYVTCVAERVAALAPATVVQAQLPVADLYRFSFSSPRLSFDFAGFSVMVLVALLVTILLRITGVIMRNYLIRQRYADVDRL